MKRIHVETWGIGNNLNADLIRSAIREAPEAVERVRMTGTLSVRRSEIHPNIWLLECSERSHIGVYGVIQVSS